VTGIITSNLTVRLLVVSGFVDSNRRWSNASVNLLFGPTKLEIRYAIKRIIDGTAEMKVFSQQ
jgi:hypothetical protein